MMTISTFAKPRLQTKANLIIPVALFIIVLISRLPFITDILYHWDSVNFAYSLQEFDIARDQPQPPGYILYVMLCRGINYFINNPNLTMVLLGIVSSGLAVVALYYLGREIFNWQTGLVAALFLTFSPLFWFYGEIALPHTLDAFLVILSVLMLYKVHAGESRYDIPSVIILAVAGGFRPQTLVFLLPLTIYSFRKIGLKRFIGLGFIGAIVCLTWFVPLVYSVNGIANYFSVMGTYSERFQATTSIFKGAGVFGIKRNLTKLSIYTIYSLAGSLSGVLVVPSLLRKKVEFKWSTLIFLLIWIIPSVLYYFLIHMGQQGLVFTFLPALFLVLASLIKNALGEKENRLIFVVSMICVLNAIIFLFVPEYPLPENSQRLLTLDTLNNSDNYFRQRFDAIRSNFPPDTSLLFASNWHHLEYYLPEYNVTHFDVGSKWEINEGEVDTRDAFEVAVAETGEDKMVYVILFDPELDQLNSSQDQLIQIPLAENKYLQYFKLSPGDVLEVGDGYINLIDN